VSPRTKAAIISALIILAALGLWFGALAISDAPELPDGGIKPPASVPGPAVPENR
jgi:hypothetical protein